MTGSYAVAQVHGAGLHLGDVTVITGFQDEAEARLWVSKRRSGTRFLSAGAEHTAGDAIILKVTPVGDYLKASGSSKAEWDRTVEEHQAEQQAKAEEAERKRQEAAERRRAERIQADIEKRAEELRREHEAEQRALWLAEAEAQILAAESQAEHSSH